MAHAVTQAVPEYREVGVKKGALIDGEVELDMDCSPRLGLAPLDPVPPPPTEGEVAGEKVAGSTLAVPPLPPPSPLGVGATDTVHPFKDLLSPTDLVSVGVTDTVPPPIIPAKLTVMQLDGEGFPLKVPRPGDPLENIEGLCWVERVGAPTVKLVDRVGLTEGPFEKESPREGV